MISQYKQQGATLIVVLMLLIIITIIGVVGVRHSMTSLNIATNSQINELLRQSSDSAMLALEDADKLDQLSTASGVLGFISRPENSNKELVFCFDKNKSNSFDISQASMVEFIDSNIADEQQGEGTESNQSNQNGKVNSNRLGKRGFCNPSEAKFYTSQRNAVITQVAIKRSTAGVLEPAFSNYVTGTDFVSAKTQNNERFTIYATSVLPSIGGAKKTDIYACLSTHLNSNIQSLSISVNDTEAMTVSKCLENLGVPYITQVADYSYKVGFVGE